MSPSRVPTRSACFQPDNYESIALFADRGAMREDLTGTLRSYFYPGSPGEGRVLVRGHRGIGKSILTRVAIEELLSELGPLFVTADAGRCEQGPRMLLVEMARALSRSILENCAEPDLQSSAELLRRVSGSTRVKVKEARTWSRNLKVGMKVGAKFLDTYATEFGLERLDGRTRSLEEEYEQAVDVDLLVRLIQDLVTDCATQDRKVLIFLDNLDQAAPSELKDDVERVLGMLRLLLTLRKCVVVVNLRSEFVCHDLQKYYSRPFEVGGVHPEGLVEIAEARMATLGDKRQAMADAGFDSLLRTLSFVTDNPWAYLTWLSDFDYSVIDFDPSDLDAVKNALLSLIGLHFYGLEAEDLRLVAQAFSGCRNSFLSGREMDERGVGASLISRALRPGALIPDWLLDPQRYMLSPRLHFLVPTP